MGYRVKSDILVLCCLLHIFYLEKCFTANSRFSRNAALDGYSCELGDVVFNKDKIINRILCSSLCSQQEACVGFFYIPGSQHCIGCRPDFQKRSTTMADTMFYTRDVPRNSSGYDGYRCAIDERISVNSHIPTLAHCASTCFVNDDCQSYFHQPYTQECSLCRIAYGINGDDAGLEEWTGSLYESRYRYIGCYDDYPPRILEDKFIFDIFMTTEMCIKRCITEGRTYALTEAGSYCDCGHQLNPHGKYADTSCFQACAGDSSQTCGAGWTVPRNSSGYDGYRCAMGEIISVNSHIPTLAQCASICFVNNDCQSYFHQPNTRECSLCRKAYGINGDDAELEEWIGSLYESRYRYVGCYDDSLPRILEDMEIFNNTMTTEMCIKRCITEGRTYALTEASYHCDCGHQLNPHGKYADTSCNHACGGDSSQTCGAHWAGTVYAIRHW